MPLSPFVTITLVGWLVVVVAAALRSRPFAAFVGVLVGIYSLAAVGLQPAFRLLGPYAPVAAVFHASVYLNFALLSRPRMRALPYRLLVSWPSAFFSAGTLFGSPWAVAYALGFSPWAPWLPYAAAAIGMVQSLSTSRGVVKLLAHGPTGENIDALVPRKTGLGTTSPTQRPLRIVQISDPHLGPFMSVARLRRIAERAVAEAPDLVFLTGDFLTMESQRDVRHLTEALEPLRALPGKVFACHGNHDHEAPEIVAQALASNGVRLLVDEACEVETPAGPVQIVGMDFTWRDRATHLAKVCAAYPRTSGSLRIVLLHDPGAFGSLPPGEGDLVLAGHTHGGQIGLLSLGIPWTVVRSFGGRIPDQGLWARGTDRLYVHRGTGHYGFPLRLGVSAEESVLEVHLAQPG